MNDFIYRLKNLPFYLCAPFFFCAFILVIINVLALFPSESFEMLYYGISRGACALFSVSAALFITYYICKNSKKAFAAGFCILLFDLILFTLCSVHISLIFGIAFSLLYAFIFSKNELFPAFSLCVLISLAVGLTAGLANETAVDFIKMLCASLKGRGALFGAVNNLYSLLFSDRLAQMFLNKDYSGSAFTAGKVISGVMSVFKAQGVAGINASRYLAGKYFVNFFVCSSAFVLIYSRLDSNGKSALIACFALAAVFGDIRLFSLFILIYNPLMYIGMLLLTVLSYLTAYFLDIRLVYLKEGSLAELLKYRDKLGYFLLAGVIIFALSYFTERIILSKFDFQSRKIVPKEVKTIVNALGGDENIQSIQGTDVILKNPNLIDILKLDCDIKGNRVTLSFDDLRLIKKFY